MKGFVYKNKKNILVSIVLLFIVVSAFFLYKKQTSKKRAVLQDVSEKQSKNKLLGNLKVQVTKGKRKGSVVLKIQGIPEGTTEVEYELTYPTKDKGLQGVIGTLDEIEGKSYEKEIFLGTCSSGTCVQHKLAGSISLLLRFRGSFGEISFENEYTIGEL